jgi:hypothetical protein
MPVLAPTDKMIPTQIRLTESEIAAIDRFVRQVIDSLGVGARYSRNEGMRRFMREALATYGIYAGEDSAETV